jgi:prefoldin subunit 5
MSKNDKIMVNPSEGYFLAKRQMVEAIDSRLEKLNKELEKNKDTIQEVESLRNYVRNHMLWFKGDGE